MIFSLYGSLHDDSSFLAPNFFSTFQRHDLQVQSQILEVRVWGTPAPQVSVESQYRKSKFLPQQWQLANDSETCILEARGVWTCVSLHWTRTLRVGQYARLYNFFVCRPKFTFTTFFASSAGILFDQLLFRLFDMICSGASRKLSKIAPSFRRFFALPNFRGRAFQKLYHFITPARDTSSGKSFLGIFLLAPKL